MKRALLLTLALCVTLVGVSAFGDDTEKDTPKSIYEFQMKNIDGKEVNLKDFKGKVLLVVNVASKCGYTPQYKDLVQIYKKYNKKGFEVLGFPANEFGKQEPGTNFEIKEFCTENYSVNFPIFSKIVVKGDEIHPLFKYLTTQKNPDFEGEIKWNFEKILISHDGKVLRRYRSKVKPTDEVLTKAVEKALEAKS